MSLGQRIEKPPPDLARALMSGSGVPVEENFAAALAGHPAAVVRHSVVGDEREAAEAGTHGSPTLLVDGTDPFAAPGQPPSLSCRLYRDASGRAGPVTTVEKLRRVLTAAGDD